jgi:carboxyl-terminal processing protease
MRSNHRLSIAFLGLFSFFALACRDQSLPPFANEVQVNRWVEKQMNLWYYWNTELPANPDYQQTPGSFFNNLLYTFDAQTKPDGDRFSWIQQSADDLISSLSGEVLTYGMEYRIVTATSLNRVVGSVLYVLEGSPADKAGVKRGDFFTHINGTELSSSNSRNLLAGTSEKKFTFGTLNESADGFVDIRERAIAPVRFQEDPVHFNSIISSATKKIGYLVYHQFYPSTNGTNDFKYDKKLEGIFAEFKKQQINELIIDLRYNSGGYVSSSILLGSLMAKGVTSKDIFAIKQYNAEISRILTKSYGEDFFKDYFLPKPQNVGDQLTRVFVLTSKRTASASELLINGLLPYIDVKVVGETTVGKNVGSVTLTDAEDRTRWGIQPIVSKSFNSLMKSDYSSGFAPDYPASEGLRIHPYGDARDPLLRAALNAIVEANAPGNARIAAIGDSDLTVTEISSSLSDKPGRSSMFDNLPVDLLVSHGE